MRKSNIRHLALATTAFWIIASTPVLASEAGVDGNEDIIVTARRTEERLQDVPISITVYNQEQLERRNVINAADLGAYTPSLSSDNRFGPEKSTFVIRGFVQDFGTAPSVGVYFADVIAPQAAGSTPGGNGTGVGNMFDLQNVQVLKGPQGTLFGKNTTGGAVLLVPKRPTDRVEGYVEGSLGNYGMWRGQAVLNLPLSDTFKIRLGVDRMKRDGYLRNHTSIGPKDFADTDYFAARFSVVADLTPDLENYLVATYANSHNNGNLRRMLACTTTPTTAQQGIGAFYGCGQIARQAARGDSLLDVENSHPNPEFRARQWQIINTTTWRASDALTVKNIASYGEYRERLRQAFGGDYFLNPLNPAATTFDLNYVWFDVAPGQYGAHESTFTEELQLQGASADGKLNWQAGGYMEISDPIGTAGTTSPIFLKCTNHYALQCAGNGVVRAVRDKFWFRNYALYAQASYRLTDKLGITGGFRYTWDSSRQTDRTYSIAFPAPNVPFYFCGNTARFSNPDGSPIATSGLDPSKCGLEFKVKSSKPTWLLNVDYKPNEDLLLYAKWARGYRKGGVAALNPFFETWEPEKVDLYELGAKLSFSGALDGYFNVAAYYNDFQNQQIQAGMTAASPRFAGGSAVINAGKSRIWGIEVDTSISPIDGLHVDAGYAYLNTKVLELTVPPVPIEAQSLVAGLVPSAITGGELAFSPKHRVTISANYTLPLDESIGEVTVGGTYTYTAKQVVTLATAPQFIPLKGGSLVNLNASWNSLLGTPLDLSFFMTNVANRKYIASVGGSWVSLGFENGVPGEPRMWGFRVKYHFGN